MLDQGTCQGQTGHLPGQGQTPAPLALPHAPTQPSCAHRQVLPAPASPPPPLNPPGPRHKQLKPRQAWEGGASGGTPLPAPSVSPSAQHSSTEGEVVSRGLVPLSVQTDICQASLPTPPSVHSSHSFSKSSRCLPGALGCCCCRGQGPAGTGRSPLSLCGLPWAWVPARRGGRRNRRMKRRLAGQGHRCHHPRRPTCPQTQSWGSLGTESLRGPARSDGWVPAASQPALAHSQGSAPQMVVAPPLLSPPQTCKGWDGSHGGSGNQGRRQEGRKQAGGRWHESGGRACGFIWS